MPKAICILGLFSLSCFLQLVQASVREVKRLDNTFRPPVYSTTEAHWPCPFPLQPFPHGSSRQSSPHIELKPMNTRTACTVTLLKTVGVHHILQWDTKASGIMWTK